MANFPNSQIPKKLNGVLINRVWLYTPFPLPSISPLSSLLLPIPAPPVPPSLPFSVREKSSAGKEERFSSPNTSEEGRHKRRSSTHREGGGEGISLTPSLQPPPPRRSSIAVVVSSRGWLTLRLADNLRPEPLLSRVPFFFFFFCRTEQGVECSREELAPTPAVPSNQTHLVSDDVSAWTSGWTVSTLYVVRKVTTLQYFSLILEVLEEEEPKVYQVSFFTNFYYLPQQLYFACFEAMCTKFILQ